MFAIVNFQAHYMYTLRSLNPQFYAVCLYCQDFDNNSIADDDALILRATQYQHAM